MEIHLPKFNYGALTWENGLTSKAFTLVIECIRKEKTSFIPSRISSSRKQRITKHVNQSNIYSWSEPRAQCVMSLTEALWGSSNLPGWSFSVVTTYFAKASHNRFLFPSSTNGNRFSSTSRWVNDRVTSVVKFLRSHLSIIHVSFL